MSGYAGAPWWQRVVAPGHVQTIVPATLYARPAIHYRRERIDTPDGDFVDFDWRDGAPGQPLVIHFHGLEGSSQSHYAVSLMAAVAARGWNGVVCHFRGCSGEPNRLVRAYHSGDSQEIGWMIATCLNLHKAWLKKHASIASSSNALTQPRPERVFAAGVSLGGNALLKWLGEQGDAALQWVDRAACVSAPLDLAAGGHALGVGFNRLYTRMFLQTLKTKSAAKLARFPGSFDGAAMHAARNLYEFDNLVTAPLHGFRDTDHYWREASAKPWLGAVRVPTLVLNAKNDPFLPRAALPAQAEVSATVRLEQPEHGGHVGFAGNAAAPGLTWLPQRILHFFDQP